MTSPSGVAERVRSRAGLLIHLRHAEKRVQILRAKLDETLLRDVEIYVARVEQGQSLRSLARAYGVHTSTISRICAAVEELREVPSVQTMIEAAKCRTR